MTGPDVPHYQSVCTHRGLFNGIDQATGGSGSNRSASREVSKT